jgi:tRNA pseudouridine-54 N-methylase
MVEGDKLRYMGPNERSISILLSMSAKKLSSAELGRNPESSPGITTLKKNVVSSLVRRENSLLFYQSDEGLDLRTIKFTENTVFICRLNRELNLESFIHLFGNETQNMCRVKSEDEAEKAILLTNIEIDRQHT